MGVRGSSIGCVRALGEAEAAQQGSLLEGMRAVRSHTPALRWQARAMEGVAVAVHARAPPPAEVGRCLE